MTTATRAASPSILARRIFGECSRYRVDVMATRFGTVEFFLMDADTSGDPFCAMQSETLSGCLAHLPAAEQEDFLVKQPSRAGQVAINLDRHPVKVIKFDDKGVLVQCLGTKQQWYCPANNLVLAS